MISALFLAAHAAVAATPASEKPATPALYVSDSSGWITPSATAGPWVWMMRDDKVSVVIEVYEDGRVEMHPPTPLDVASKCFWDYLAQEGRQSPPPFPNLDACRAASEVSP